MQIYSSTDKKPNMYYRKRPAWTAAQVPLFTMRDKKVSNPTFLMNLASYSRMANPYTSLN
jgi:hypothetical protein